jgi:hypothetical protein
VLSLKLTWNWCFKKSKMKNSGRCSLS